MRLFTMAEILGLLLASAAGLQAQEPDARWRDPYDSGGPLIREEAAYDVGYYDLDITVDPGDSTIAGTLHMDARVVSPTEVVALDLDTLLAIESISSTDLETPLPLRYTRAAKPVVRAQTQ